MAEEPQSNLKESITHLLALYGVELDEENGNDYSQIIGKTQEKLDELNEKAASLYERIGMTPEQLEAYASNPNNFNDEQWSALQRVHEEIESFTKSSRTLLSSSSPPPTAPSKKKKEEQKFGKKKNWIPL